MGRCGAVRCGAESMRRDGMGLYRCLAGVRCSVFGEDVGRWGWGGRGRERKKGSKTTRSSTKVSR